MNKKIYALLLLVFVLVTLSAVSAADVQDNNQTLALDSSSDIVAVSNDDSNALKISNDDEIKQISDSDDDVLGAGSGISITSCPSTMDYGNPYEKLKFEIFIIGPDGSNYGEIPSATVWLNVDGERIASTTSDEDYGEGSFSLSSLPSGTHIVKCEYDGSDYYDASESATKTITVNGGDTPSEKTIVYLENYDGVPSIEMNYGDSKTYTAAVYSDDQYSHPLSGVPLKLTAGSNIVRATSNANGEATFDLSTITPGTYTATIDVDSDDYEADSTFTIGLTVNGDAPEKTTVYLYDNAHPSSMTEGDSESLSVMVENGDTGAYQDGVTLKVTIDKDYSITTANAGIASLDLSEVPAGTYTVRIVVNDANYESSDVITYDLTVNSADPVVKTSVYLDDGYHPTEPIAEGDNVQITAYVADDVVNLPGVRVKATIDKDYYAVSDDNGMVSFDLSGVPAGQYHVVLVVDDDNYKSDALEYDLTVTGITEVTLNKANAEDERVITVGANEFQAYIVLDKDTMEVSGVNVKVTIGDIVMNSATDEYGGVDFDLSTIPVGTYDIIAVVDQEGYKSNTVTIPLTVNKVESNLTADRFGDENVLEIKLGDKVVLNASLVDFKTDNPISGATVVFIIDGTDYTNVTDENGKVSYTVSGLTVGNHTVNYRFDGSENYTADTNLSDINDIISVSKIDTHISVKESSLDLKVEGSAPINATLTPADAGALTYTSSNTSVVTVDKNGNVEAIAVGEANITVSFAGDDDTYAPAEDVVVAVTVSKIDTSISVDEESLDLNVSDDSVIVATLSPADAGAVTFTSSNESVVTVDDGNVKAVGAGEATITVSFAGSDKYNAAEDVTVSVKVSKIDTEITVANETVSLKVEGEIDSGASLDPIDAGDLTYKSDNESVVKVVDGKLVAVGEGTATVNVSFDGNEKYNKAESKTIQVTVSLNDATVSAEDITLDVDANKTINLITNPNGLNVTYTPDNSGVVTVDDNGLVTGLKGGSANVTITIVGNGKYYENSTTITVTVNKLDATISVSDKVEMNVGDSVNLNATLTPADAGNLTYYSLSSFVEIDENGTIVAISEGNASVVVAFNGNEKYNPVNAKVITVTVKKIDTTISVNDKVDMKVDDIVDANAKLTPADAGDLTYKSDNEAVVKVEGGKLVAVGVGDATVTVSFDGNEKYNKAESKTIDVTVRLIDASVVAEDITLNVGANATINATTTPEGLTIDYVVDNSGVVTVENGVVTAVKAGTADVTITIVGNGKYYENSTTITVTVKKIDTSIDVENKSLELYVDEEGRIVATLNPDGGDVNFTSSDESIITVDNFGEFKANATGTATITVSFAGDDKYNAAENVTVTVKVSKIDTSIEFNYDPINLTVHNETMVIATLKPAEAGNVTYTSSNTSVVTVDNEGNVKAVGAGNATITASFKGNDKYNEAESVSVPVTVSKIDTKIAVDTESLDLKVGNETTVKCTLTPSEAGKVSYMSNNDSVVTVDENTGKVTAVSEGTATIIVYYDGNDDYNMADDVTISVTVSKIDTSIEVDKKSLDLKVGKDSTVTAKLTPADAGAITFTSSDESVVTVDKNGKVTAVGAGSATVTVSFAGNDKYNAAKDVTVAVSVKENKQNASMDVDADKAVEDENSTITVNLPKDATGNVTAVIEGNPYTAPVVNGTATITVPGLRPGNYTAHVTYSGDDKYNPASKDINYEVEEIDKSDIISAPDVTKYFGGSERFVVNITDYKGNPVANKSVTIEINGQKYDRTTKDDGTTSIGLALNSGVFNVTVTVGNKTVNSVVTVLPTVNGTDVVKVYRNATPYYATFRDSEGNYLKEGTVVTFNINGVMYERKISGSEGLAKLNLNLEQGTYVLTAMNPQTGENAANNITIIPRLVENKDITKYYRNATQYTVKVLGDDGNPVGAGETVTFNINGVMYNRQTNESGIAKLNLNLQPDDYIITAEYKNCKVSNKIKILPVLSASDISMKYRDGTKFVATLVDGQGKPFAGQTIQFNINGVFYNRVTDANGQAKLNINLQAGQYIITSSYNGANIANTVTISA